MPILVGPITPRQGLSTLFASLNKVYLSGEVLRETDTGKQKTADGVTTYNALPYDVTPVALAAKADTTAVNTALGLKVATSRTINGKSLTADVVLAKTDIAGLNLVDNTPDAQKPVSALQATAITTAINGLVGAAPGALDTLNELATALGDDPNFATTITNSIATKVPGARMVAGHPLTSDVTIVKGDVGLSAVDNTADAAKPVSVAQAAAISVKAGQGDVLPIIGRRRGMSIDDASGLYSAEQIALFGRFNCNIARFFMRCEHSSLTAAYGPPPSYGFADMAAWLAVVKANVAALAAIGVQSIIVLVPQRTGFGEERADNAFFNSAAARTQFAACWATVAAAFPGDTRVFAFDTINEAYHVELGTTFAAQDDLNALHDQCITAIRAVDPTRLCIVSPSVQGQAFGYKYMKPVQSANVLYSLHFYQPFLLSQALIGFPAYTDTYPSVGKVGGGTGAYDQQQANKTRILNELQEVIAFQTRTGAQMIVGEFAPSALLPPNVGPDFNEDCIAIFEQLGWHWVFLGMSFPPVQFATFEMPFSTAGVVKNDGTNGNVNTTIVAETGAVHQARTAIAPVGDACQRLNALWPTVTAHPLPTGIFPEDFEVSASGGNWTSATLIGSGFTANLAATVNPRSGTKHGRFTNVSSTGGYSALLLNTQSADPEFYLSFDFCCSLAMNASIILFQVNSLLGTDNSNLGLYYDITNGLYFLHALGSAPAVQYNIPHAIITPGVYTRLKFHVLSNTGRGRMRFWQDGRCLVDINSTATVTVAGNALSAPQIGYVYGSQQGLSIDIDNIKYSRGAGNVDAT